MRFFEDDRDYDYGIFCDIESNIKEHQNPKKQNAQQKNPTQSSNTYSLENRSNYNYPHILSSMNWENEIPLHNISHTRDINIVSLESFDTMKEDYENDKEKNNQTNYTTSFIAYISMSFLCIYLCLL